MKFRTVSTLGIWLAISMLCISCSSENPGDESSPAVSTEKSHGPVTATVTVNPGRVTLDRHLILTLKVTHPSQVDLVLPALSDRAEGFVVGQSFDREVTDADGVTTIEKVARLAPSIAEEYRIAPIPIVYYTSSASGPKQNWFPTPAIRLESVMPESRSGGPKDAIDPVWIRPSAREISLTLAAAVLLIALILLAIKLIRKAMRYVRLLRLSPRERALEELRMLLEKDLVSRELVKEFYLELTMIVRMFIERGYHIRAPEQTTEEFLESAAEDNRFSPRLLEKLRVFLQSADLVKFAGFKPDRKATDTAVANARDFIRVESSENPDTGRKQEVTDA